MTAILLLILAVPAAAENLVRSRPATGVLNERIELKPIDGHHFNEDEVGKIRRFPLGPLRIDAA